MWCSGHDSHLFTDRDGSAGKCDEDLTHDDVSDRLIWLAEMNHKTHTQSLEWHCEVKREPSETSGDTDGIGDDYSPEARTNGIYIGDVASVGDAEIVDCLEVAVKVRVPAVKGDKEEGSAEAGTYDGTVGEKLERNEGFAACVAFEETESDKTQYSNDEHGDDHSGVPTFLLVGGKGEREKQEDKTSGDEEETNYCIIFRRESTCVRLK